MLGTLLCIASILATYVAARRSLVAGLCAVLTVGYAYGIVRANLPSAATYMLFDGVVAALYAARIFRGPDSGQPPEPMAVRLWVLALCAWPLLLVAIPVQEPLVQILGLRAAVILVPFVLFGARLGSDERYRVALWCGVLNLVAFAFAAAEFQFGLTPFFPHNQMTEIIYRASDVAGGTAYRLPSTFLMAHAYGGTMVATLPLLIGAWMQRGASIKSRPLLAAAVVATTLGVFLSATRTSAVVLFGVLLTAIVTSGGRLGRRIACVLALGIVGYLVSREARMQRFATLNDTQMVTTRASYGVNSDVVDILAHHPFGNGLGGGGTNLPYFLSGQVHNRIAIENEYARIALEQGFPGLMLWLAFLGWVFVRRTALPNDPWRVGRRTAWAMCVMSFITAVAGEGVLISIPSSAFLFLCMGWLTTSPQPSFVHAPRRATDDLADPADDVAAAPSGRPTRAIAAAVTAAPLT